MPMISPSRVAPAGATIRLARPKSAILGTNASSGLWRSGAESSAGVPAATFDSRLKRMLAGLRSRWMIPRECACSTAQATVSSNRAVARGSCGLPSQMVRQRTPFDQLQRQEQVALVLNDLMDLDDVRMVQAGEGLRLEPRARRLRAGAGLQMFERDEAVKARWRAW